MVEASSSSVVGYQVIEGQDGKPLSIMEIARLKAIFKPVIDEFDAWEASFTEEETKTRAVFKASMNRHKIEAY